jgi:YHS domain-containing protein
VHALNGLEAFGTAASLQSQRGNGRNFFRSLSSLGGEVTTDPVCGTKVDDKQPEFELQYAGQKYVFCSEECKKEFEERPDEFAETAA